LDRKLIENRIVGVGFAGAERSSGFLK